MMPLDETQVVLEQAGFRTAVRFEPMKSLYFEDDSLMGFAAVYRRVTELLSGWKDLQNKFLAENALRLRGDRQKAWNIYAVLLAEETATPVQARQLNTLEEDFTATRKIARAGIGYKGQIRAALAPLLPINILTQTKDAMVILTAKLNEQEASFLHQVLSDENKPEDVAAWLNSW